MTRPMIQYQGKEMPCDQVPTDSLQLNTDETGKPWLEMNTKYAAHRITAAISWQHSRELCVTLFEAIMANGPQDVKEALRVDLNLPALDVADRPCEDDIWGPR